MLKCVVRAAFCYRLGINSGDECVASVDAPLILTAEDSVALKQLLLCWCSTQESEMRALCVYGHIYDYRAMKHSMSPLQLSQERPYMYLKNISNACKGHVRKS